MQVIQTRLRDVKILSPRRFGDDRGWFAEMFNRETFAGLGLPGAFVQDNQSLSSRGVLRGLHYQLGKPQGKLVRVLSGHIWDVAVDLSGQGSPDFGKHAGFRSAATERRPAKLELLWIPEGFAHGFLVLSDTAEVLYKTTDFYHPAGERCVRWDDPTLAIAWPLAGPALGGMTPAVSAKDAAGQFTRLEDAELPEPFQRRTASEGDDPIAPYACAGHGLALAGLIEPERSRLEPARSQCASKLRRHPRDTDKDLWEPAGGAGTPRTRLACRTGRRR